MSLHIFNSINKSWKMYTHTLSSISGDHLTLKPHDGKNILLEVSANKDIFIKQGDASYNLINLINGTGTSSGIVSGSDVSLSNLDISGTLNPLIINGSSIGLDNRNWNTAYINAIYGETLNTYRSDKTLSINSDILMISGELFTNGNINPLNNNGSSLGLPSKTWGNAYIRDLSIGSIEVSGHIMPLRDLSSNLGSSLRRLSTLFIDDLSVNKINGQAFTAGTAIVLTSVSGDIIPSNTNLFKLGDVSRNWNNAYIRDLSVSSIDVSMNLNPLLNNGSTLGVPGKIWGNAYIRDVSVSSIDVSVNLNPLTNNGSSLGLINKLWGNAYIRDASVSSIDVSQNLNPLTNNGSSLGLSTRRWGNAYLRDVSVSSIDVSNNLNPLTHNGSSLGLPGKIWGNAYIRDVSAGNIDITGNLNPFTTNTSSLGLPSKIWGNAYIRDVSVNSIDVSGNLNPLLNNTLTLGLPTRIWNNAYIRDLSVSSIEISGNILPLITNNSNLGSSLNTWKTHFAVDLSVNTINGAAYSAGGGSSSYVITSISSDIHPSLTNTYNLGSTTKYWNNAYIRNLRVSNRAYQEISGDISWSAVNGHYGLAKDAYPALNPLSSGAKAVSNWAVTTRFTWAVQSICWSPQLAIFVGVGAQIAAWSTDGVNWTLISLTSQNSLFNNWWLSVCWSPELLLFVAVSYEGRVIRSLNGITWTLSATFSTFILADVCWSPELSMFAAITQAAITNGVITSSDGITWYQQTNIPAYVWTCICWSPELRIFAALSGNASMISSNGIDWSYNSISNQGVRSICWSRELGIFVGVGGNPPGNSVISNNGINWTSYIMPWGTSGSPWKVAWSPQLKLFVTPNNFGGGKFIAHSTDGKNWTIITYSGEYKQYTNIVWSPELGIFACLSTSGGNGAIHTALTSSLKGRPPTSYNVFDSSFNSIDETGKWTFVNVATTGTLTVNTTVYNSDDRLKHNEVIINNGLTVIDQLCPKFYQKTQTLLDASYNGDLSGLDWTYEAGLIAQEVLQVPDLSFVVGGGDYYERVMVSDVSDVRYALSYYEQKMNSDLSFANGYKEQKINNDLSFTISYYQEKMYSDLSFGFDGSYNIQQILNDLSFDVSYHILKMNNDLSFYLSYNEQKINYDLSFELNYSQQLTINDLSRPNYYEVSGNLIKQPYTLNYNSVYVYGLAAIKELHAKVKAQETSLLNRQTIINSLTSRIEALEHNLSS